MGADIIAEWGFRNRFDGVVWTALGPRFDDVDGRLPSRSQVLQYLRELIDLNEAANAEEYVRKAPAQVRTPYRVLFEEQLGWAPSF